MNRTIENPVLRETVTFVRTAAETGGALSELEISLRPGGGNPLHYHTSYTETFTALEGDLELELSGGHIVTLRPGESRVVQRGEVHRFSNASARMIRFRNEVYPGHEGFERTLRILSGLAADGLYNDQQRPKNFTHVAICAMMSDMRLPGGMSLLTPLLWMAALRGRRLGTEAQLLKKYCSGS